MLEIFGTIGGNALGLPGLLGVALGMMTRHIWLAALMGGLVGIVETFLFAGWQFANLEMLELVVAIVVGVLAGCVGCVIRLKGASV
ncbi:hypothetical protein C8N32_101169 [Rhodovulum imhoffii]|uniref:Uncharacterized protein n=1 Tax=Rhodovulum imhoffii TaxID=365340 RepID=A0A2T5BWH0_9RHOB|nr:hypothetical protein [Rhodovulum imhoffii]MBK5935063.1 hypothetical protein [Rhodovulum imhoffii]PTN03972.1 hypothetical protein C8N32_101169 [Rhodovulum imhoffii]